MVKVVYNFGLLILFLIVAIPRYLFIELRGGPGYFWVIFFVWGCSCFGIPSCDQMALSCDGKYGSLIEGAMVGANMRTELDIIEEVELLLCPTWVGGEG